ncbi:tRNA guanosine(34) transglycosylase Tgt [Putridiphycobacter roseus]|uniref:Queuine tRNA-ribosyltransferase n=1 Tax=Putridiphycobacter roseus TaxID=2219161 RepID=A0A2W1NBL4_9FLAO|nr:tRNA guanosine(34) transglycosylase Tgt [Putridiphycobacter roseus]PZE16715.1 tRNA guanosine(34) transglycosylase Tgt [Putridiphycobacter roseus]
MNFKLESTDPKSKARTGTLTTAHGEIKTPIFMPVGTAGTVKGLHQHELKNDVKAQIILGNTYHLYLRPGIETLEKAGGLHKFMNWDMPILTDSGGYQVYSLSGTRKINENGVKFQSHIDGSSHLFTPEYAMDIQRSIGADLIMAFDECTPYPCEYNYARRSMHMTHRWLKRCVDRFDSTTPLYGYDQTLLPIIQGSVYKDLRKESAETIASFDLPANAIGGLSVGEPDEDLYEMTDLVCDYLPKEKPRYLMGVGTPINLLECIALGIDMFDCVLPTRNARHGTIYTQNGIMNVKNLKWKDDFTCLDENGTSYVDSTYSKSYVRHLFTVNEALGKQITSIHNLAFYLWLVGEARTQIEAGTFTDWKNKMVVQLAQKL